MITAKTRATEWPETAMAAETTMKAVVQYGYGPADALQITDIA